MWSLYCYYCLNLISNGNVFLALNTKLANVPLSRVSGIATSIAVLWFCNNFSTKLFYRNYQILLNNVKMTCSSLTRKHAMWVWTCLSNGCICSLFVPGASWETCLLLLSYVLFPFFLPSFYCENNALETRESILILSGNLSGSFQRLVWRFH